MLILAPSLNRGNDKNFIPSQNPASQNCNGDSQSLSSIHASRKNYLYKLLDVKWLKNFDYLMISIPAILTWIIYLMKQLYESQKEQEHLIKR